jgi:hypothetical protein
MKKEELGKVLEAIVILIIAFILCAILENHA